MEEKLFGPVRFLPGKNQGKYPFCHSIYIEGAGVLIDPASDRRRLIKLRKDMGVKEVWLSHWHEDHLMHLDLFDDLPLRIMEPDALPLTDLDLFIASYGEFNDKEREFWRVILKEQFHFRPRKPDHFLRDGEIFEFEDLTVEVIGAPGHTPGHCALLFQEPCVLFLADYDLTRFGPWYGDVASSIEATVHSINRLRKIPAELWVSAHETGIFYKNPGKLWNRYLGVIDQREERLLEFLKEPRTFEDVVGAWIIYGKPREPREFYEFGERAHMKKHLEKLMKDDTVKKADGRYFYAG